jgi:hypothetical protein
MVPLLGRFGQAVRPGHRTEPQQRLCRLVPAALTPSSTLSRQVAIPQTVFGISTRQDKSKTVILDLNQVEWDDPGIAAAGFNGLMVMIGLTVGILLHRVHVSLVFSG